MTALPVECEGFRTTRRTRLVNVWGAYGLKHAANILALRWTPDGRELLTHHHGVFSLWDAATGEETRRFPAPGRVRDAEFTPDGRWIVYAASDGVSAVEVAPPYAARVVARFPRQSYALAVTPDGARVAVAVWDGTIRHCDLATGREFARSFGTGSLVLTPDGRSVVARTPDDGAALFDLDTGRIRSVLDPPERRSGVWAFTPDGAAVALGFPGPEGFVMVREVATGAVRWQARCHESGILSLAFSADGQELYTTAWAGDGFRVWDAASGDALRDGRPFCVPSGAALAAGRVAYAPDRSRAAVLVSDEEVRLVDLTTLREVTVHEGHRCCVSAVAFTPDGRAAITASYDRTLRVRDVATGATEWTFECPAAETAGGHRPQLTYGDGSDAVWQYASGDAGPHDVSVAPDGRAAFTAGPGDVVRVWDLVTGVEREPWRGHTDGVKGLDLSRDGALAVTCGGDQTVRVWDVYRAAPRRVLLAHDGYVHAAVLAPTGERVLVVGEELVRVFDVAEGAVRATFEGADQPGDSGGVARWLPDGLRALVGAWWGDAWRVVLWNTVTGEVPHALDLEREVTALAPSPDGRLCAVASADGAVRLWEIESGATVDVIDLAASLDSATTLAFAPDGAALLVGTRRGVVLRFALDDPAAT